MYILVEYISRMKKDSNNNNNNIEKITYFTKDNAILGY